MDQNTEVSLKSAGAIVEPKTVTFAFGKNWKNFLTIVDDDRIRRAENSLKYMLKKDTLAGITFLDAGCGSGLFSLAAARLGAKRVVSFDVDADSVQCARFLQEKYGPLPQWDITHGSVLDKDWLATLGKFDVVYSWGVLHHTGDMWRALDNIVTAVAPHGTLFISIYNDQGAISRFWTAVKKMYNRVPKVVKFLMVSGWFLVVLAYQSVLGIIRLKSPRSWFQPAGIRGMNIWYDAVDWIGGYPFETASPEDIFRFYRDRGFVLTEMSLKKGMGCSEYVFSHDRTA